MGKTTFKARRILIILVCKEKQQGKERSPLKQNSYLSFSMSVVMGKRKPSWRFRFKHYIDVLLAYMPKAYLKSCLFFREESK